MNQFQFLKTISPPSLLPFSYIYIAPIGSVSLENTNTIYPFFTWHSCNHTFLKINIYMVLFFKKSPCATDYSADALCGHTGKIRHMPHSQGNWRAILGGSTAGRWPSCWQTPLGKWILGTRTQWWRYQGRLLFPSTHNTFSHHTPPTVSC